MAERASAPAVLTSTHDAAESSSTPRLIDGHTGYPYYTHLSQNSDRLHSQFLRGLSLYMQRTGAAFLMSYWNQLKVYDHSKYIHALRPYRPANQGLITVGNHQSTIDDPGVLAAMTPWSVMTDIHASRWSWCAREMCFPSKFTGWFFLTGKIFPIVRGAGLFQQGVREADEHIRRGEHVNIFPEGKCIPVPNGIAKLRWGTAKLTLDAYRRTRRCEEMKEAMRASAAATSASHSSNLTSIASPAPESIESHVPPTTSTPSPPSCPLPPLVLPYVHHGMPAVMPFYHIIPKRGHTVRCIVGDPIEFQDLIDFHEKNHHNRLAYDYPAEEDLLVAMTDRIYDRMVELDRKLVQIEKDEQQQEAQTKNT